MKTLLRENRIPNGTKAKVRRIVKDLRANPPAEPLVHASGAMIFAVWKEQQGRSRR